MSASFGVDFGQKVDLTASIRNILRNYPEGTAVLKELIQNADDAGARKVCFTLDKRSHATTSLADANLAQFQGPGKSPLTIKLHPPLLTTQDELALTS